MLRKRRVKEESEELQKITTSVAICPTNLSIFLDSMSLGKSKFLTEERNSCCAENVIWPDAISRYIASFKVDRTQLFFPSNFVRHEYPSGDNLFPLKPFSSSSEFRGTLHEKREIQRG